MFAGIPVGYVWVAVGVVCALVAVFSLKGRGYRRKFQGLRARDWQKVDGVFDEGEIIRMMKGRSTEVAGFQVWLGYRYAAEKEYRGLYATPTIGKEDAEEILKRLANQKMVVRVAPGKAGRSRVVEEDLGGLLGDRRLRQR